VRRAFVVVHEDSGAVATLRDCPRLAWVRPRLETADGRDPYATDAPVMVIRLAFGGPGGGGEAVDEIVVPVAGVQGPRRTVKCVW
jgi:hypothetical protein